MTRRPRMQPISTRARSVGPTGWPADQGGHLVGRRLSRPHCLKSAMWTKIIGSLSRFTEDQLQKKLLLAVALSFYYDAGIREVIGGR